MEQEIRNRLQKATQQLRALLEQDFADQLEGSFDILPDGRILPEAGKHLDLHGRFVRQKLVDTIASLVATGKSSREAVDAYTRESAFTFLNRFVALRMLEARGVLQECVSQGPKSSGFKEFCGLASGLSSVTDGGYRIYLECLFDELSIEIKDLFDRTDSASLLWPRHTTLTQVIHILSQQDLAKVWAEDETIGWVYQYFNSAEERREMRESQAPRNSRELAVRNQFFTAAYVVQFLTDNTLGRLWYEMRSGETRLAETCKYLTMHERQLATANAQAISKRTTPHKTQQTTVTRDSVRRKKDPRDLKVLDPACGSGHFLLYAFDLLVIIYEEAWSDTDSPAWTVSGTSLSDDYPRLEDLYEALPGLILRHNLYGVEIDHRAAQIAALALWMRAQRVFNDKGVRKQVNRRVTKTNIVVAEPIATEPELLQAFLRKQETTVSSLAQTVVEQMHQASELGSLLAIERAIRESISANTSISESDWPALEQQLLDALDAYANELIGTEGFRRHLFTDDAVGALAFIDLCRQQYDVILMNPPFGDPIERTKKYITKLYPNGSGELYSAFLLRALDLAPDGMVGMLSSRMFLFKSEWANWRKQIRDQKYLPTIVADLGSDVLDGALVEAAASVFMKQAEDEGTTLFLDVLNALNKESELQQFSISSKGDSSPSIATQRQIREFIDIPGEPWLYSMPSSVISLFSDVQLGGRFSEARSGVCTGDDFRFLRLLWEVPLTTIGREGFLPLSKGGEYRPFADDVHLLLDWRSRGQDMRLLKGARVQGLDTFFKTGISYPLRTRSAFGPRALPGGVVVSNLSQLIVTDNPVDATTLIGYGTSRFAQACVELVVGGGDARVSGGPARSFTAASVGSIPFPESIDHAIRKLHSDICKAHHNVFAIEASSETSAWFGGLGFNRSDTPHQSITKWWQLNYRLKREVYQVWEKIESTVKACLAGDYPEKWITSTIGPDPTAYDNELDDVDLQVNIDMDLRDIVQQGTRRGIELGSHLTRKCFVADRIVEAWSHVYKRSPKALFEKLESSEPSPKFLSNAHSSILSLCHGVLVGRWTANIFFDSTTLDPDKIFYDIPLEDRQTKRHTAILVDDEGHPNDVVANLESLISDTWPGVTAADFVQTLNAADIRTWYRRHFFDAHLGQYSASRRQAPIYWQLSTPSASYSVWLYYHALSRDTLFQVSKDFVKPKLEHERKKLDKLREEGGSEPSRSQRRLIEDQEAYVVELAWFSEQLEILAPLWNPDLTDGVLINFAPLWRLVPQHKSWQERCKTCWDELCRGEYDWSQLAMHLWPQRVIEKCGNDASLAIAHKLTNAFWKYEKDRLRPQELRGESLATLRTSILDAHKNAAIEAALRTVSEGSSSPYSTAKPARRKKGAS